MADNAKFCSACGTAVLSPAEVTPRPRESAQQPTGYAAPPAKSALTSGAERRAAAALALKIPEGSDEAVLVDCVAQLWPKASLWSASKATAGNLYITNRRCAFHASKLIGAMKLVGAAVAFDLGFLAGAGLQVKDASRAFSDPNSIPLAAIKRVELIEKQALFGQSMEWINLVVGDGRKETELFFQVWEVAADAHLATYKAKSARTTVRQVLQQLGV
jgi:hypothetical protein